MMLVVKKYKFVTWCFGEIYKNNINYDTDNKPLWGWLILEKGTITPFKNFIANVLQS